MLRLVLIEIRTNRTTTRSRWKFRICTTTNDFTLYSLSSLYTFVTWGWPTVAETCCQPNKIDTKTIAFWRTYPLLTKKTVCSKRSWYSRQTIMEFTSWNPGKHEKPYSESRWPCRDSNKAPPITNFRQYLLYRITLRVVVVPTCSVW